MIKELCIIGHPSLYGGADTELLDQIKCWTKMGIKIYICHTGLIDNNLKKLDLSNKYNCIYLKPRQWNEIKGMHCISFCNGEFLTNLRHIKKFAKTTTFVNCMTWNFQKEIQAQHDGLIDFHLYQTDHALEKVSKNLKQLGIYRPIKFTPYFDSTIFPYYDKRPNDHFRFGRISRSDTNKFSSDQMYIYDNIESPIQKSGVILGWNMKIKDKLKVQPKDLSITKDSTLKFLVEYYKNYIQLLKEATISQQEFYQFCDVLIMATDTFENLPRVGMEAMSSGSILVVNNKGGWTVEVENNKTGFLCSNTNDFIKKSSLLAQDQVLKDQIRGFARESLLRSWGFEESAKSWQNVFDQWEKLIR